MSPAVGPGEARIERTEHGAAAATPGWFVLNLADARWMRSEVAGQWSDFEPPERFDAYIAASARAISLAWLQPSG